MELNLIREDKLKVLLTPFDMMKYELTCETLDYDDTKTRKAIWSILDFAKNETGFDAALGKIRIEVYPEKNGGCAIYITKLHESDPPSRDDMNDSNGKQTALPQKELTAVYKFEEAESLIRVCRFLSHRGYRAESTVFLEPKEGSSARYFLCITEKNITSSQKKAKYLRENLFIGEFGTKLDTQDALLYIGEHARALCKGNAVERLGTLST